MVYKFNYINLETMGEISTQLSDKIHNCRNCVTIIGHKKLETSSHGQINGKYLLISEAPSKLSLKRKQYWTGIGGQILRTCCIEAKTTLEKLFYMTDIVKCWPNEDGKNRTPYKSEILSCSKLLDREIEELDPTLIIAFGNSASSYLLKRVVKIRSEHGNIYQINRTCRIIVLLHPTGIDKSMDRQISMMQLTSLFKKISEGKLNDINEIFN